MNRPDLLAHTRNLLGTPDTRPAAILRLIARIREGVWEQRTLNRVGWCLICLVALWWLWKAMP